jgi:hypothetical protein
MSWPFSNVVAPNMDTGPGTDIPDSVGVVFTGIVWILGAHFSNPSDTQQTVTVVNSADDVLCVVTIAGGEEKTYDWPFRPTDGVKWSATGTGCLGHIWGYQ